MLPPSASELPVTTCRTHYPTPPCPEIALDEEDIFAIPYTSGTTGLPKGVMISHRARAITFYGMAAEYQCFSVDSHFLAIAPLCHGAGFAFGFAPLFFGGTVELMSDFDPERVISALARKEADGVFMVPAHFRQIFNLPPDILERHRGQHRPKPSSRMLRRCRSHSKSKSSISSATDYSTRPMVQPRAHRYQFATGGSAPQKELRRNTICGYRSLLRDAGGMKSLRIHLAALLSRPSTIFGLLA